MKDILALGINNNQYYILLSLSEDPCTTTELYEWFRVDDHLTPKDQLMKSISRDVEHLIEAGYAYRDETSIYNGAERKIFISPKGEVLFYNVVTILEEREAMALGV